MRSQSTDLHAAAASNEGATASHSQPIPQQPEDFLTITTVMKARGCKSPTTIWSEIRDGSFPPPDKVIKRIRYWRSSTIRQWQDSDVGLLEPATAHSGALTA
jgi:predicted DNA-binding transcriptional regulator AlpA